MCPQLNWQELMEGKLALAIRRIEGLERSQKRRLAANADELAAQELAEKLGFAVEILTLPAASSAGNQAKRALAHGLSVRGWSAERIGRVLRVSERTIRRWAVSGQAGG